ncbi:hypothetical protein G6L28_16595 [Agrobacterium larrymoorei]|uniref:hypothetical protein n=1 Tax=Agrobacterium larrymoorei TaxID=160699 RepID=UPI001572B8EA|nr:hypothetical protein [Agrobacterium larrymoorei]NTJ44220.1 hypothetical protein [Agrobacterium larrymoorei]
MTILQTDSDISERQDEYLALINLLSYAESAAEALGAASASWYIDVARQSLQSSLQGELSPELSTEDIINLSSRPVGRC